MMETLMPEILTQLGIPGCISLLLYLLISRETVHRKEDRDAQMKLLHGRMDMLESGLAKHIAHHLDYEKNICMKIDKIYDRLNPISDSVNKIQGYLEAQGNAKGK